MERMGGLFKLAVDYCGTKSGLLPNLYDSVTCTSDANGTLAPQISSLQDLLVLGGNVVRILTALSGGLAVIVIIVAALFYITSTGDPARIKRAKEILINTTIGLVLIISVYAVVTFIIGVL